MNNRGPTEEHTFTVGELFAKVRVNFFWINPSWSEMW
jgi:hypothetical protein